MTPKVSKWCGGCGQCKPIECFHKNANAKDGRQPRCIVCRSNRPGHHRATKKPSFAMPDPPSRPKVTADDVREARAAGVPLLIAGCRP